MKKSILPLSGVLILTAVLGVFTPAAFAVPVDVELILAVDVSGSISSTEFSQQRSAYVNAFQSAAIMQAIQDGPIGALAVTLVYWSSYNQQLQAVGWTLIHDTASANAFAAAVNAASRPYDDRTSISGAINFSLGLFDNEFEGTRLTIDLSTDGKNNSRTGDSSCSVTNTNCIAAVDSARDAAEAAGVIINALVITTEFSDLDDYAADHIITNGTNPPGFVLSSTNFTGIGAVLQNKLISEITGENPEDPSNPDPPSEDPPSSDNPTGDNPSGDNPGPPWDSNPPSVPEPSTFFLMGFGLLGFAILRRWT